MREIERLQIILSKNAERKDKLKSEIELLERDGQELKSKVFEAQEGAPKYELPEGLERKQLEIMELKTQMVNQIRAREE